MHPLEICPHGICKSSHTSLTIPGNTAFPCKLSYLADSQASTLGFPVNPAQLISDRTLFPLKNSRNSKLLKIFRFERTILITLKLLTPRA